MNLNYFLFALILIPLTSLSQAESIRAIQEDQDNFPYFCMGEGDDIFLLSNGIDYVDLNHAHRTTRVHYSYPGTESTFPLCAQIIDNNSFWSAWTSVKNDSLIIVTLKYDISNSKIEGIDTLTIPVAYNEYSFTKPEKHQGHYYSIISVYNLNITSEQYCLVSFDFGGSISLQANIVESVDSSNEMFSHNWIDDLEILNDSTIFLSGDKSLLSITDFTLAVKDQYFLSYLVPDRTYKESFRRPKFEVLNDSVLFGHCTWFYGSNSSREELFFSVPIGGDTVIIDTLAIVSNPENLDKSLGQDLRIKKNSIITSTNADFQLSTNKADFPCSFYLTRFDGFNESWHKSYGGDHYYRMRSIELIDSCKILIAGSVFDYFDNGYLQGFYAIVDCNGELLTSNVELTETDVTVYPNPTTGPLYLEGIDQGRYVIFDLLGRSMVQGEIDGGVIDLGPIGPGAYFLKIEGSNEVVKFVKG